MPTGEDRAESSASKPRPRRRGFSFAMEHHDISITICTIKSFPYVIAHTIQWSREIFDGYFVQAPANTIKDVGQELLEKMTPEKYLEMKKNARKTAEKFSEERFKKEILEFVNKHARTT